MCEPIGTFCSIEFTSHFIVLYCSTNRIGNFENNRIQRRDIFGWFSKERKLSADELSQQTGVPKELIEDPHADLLYMQTGLLFKKYFPHQILHSFSIHIISVL